MKEIEWRPIVGFSKYEINENGDVRFADTKESVKKSYFLNSQYFDAISDEGKEGIMSVPKALYDTFGIKWEVRDKPKDKEEYKIRVICDSWERQNGVDELLYYLNNEICDTTNALGVAIRIISQHAMHIDEDKSNYDLFYTINRLNELQGHLFKLGMCERFFGCENELPKMYKTEWE